MNTRRLRQRLAHGDAVRLFEGADADESGDLSLEKFEAAFGSAADAEVVRQLFRELDSNGDGLVSCQEFKDGLQSVPVADDLDVLKGLLHTLNLTDLIAQHLYVLVQQRLETGQEMTTDTVRRHMCREDITTVLKVCLCAFVRDYVVGFLSLFQTWIFETRSNDFFYQPSPSLVLSGVLSIKRAN